MAPNKFEKQTKDVLERRTIIPSETAWNKLNKQLDTEDKKRKQSFWWLGIAATLLGVLLAVTILYKKTETQKPIIVNQKTNNLKNTKPTLKTNSVKDVIVTKQEDVIATIKEENKPSKIDVVPNKKSSLNDTTKPYLAHKEQVSKELLQPVIKEFNTEIAVTSPVTNQNEVTEADKLLEQALNQFKVEKYHTVTNQINAEDLLEEVEMASEKSLKHRLFHVVKSGYETVKSTVVSNDK